RGPARLCRATEGHRQAAARYEARHQSCLGRPQVAAEWAVPVDQGPERDRAQDEEAREGARGLTLANDSRAIQAREFLERLRSHRPRAQEALKRRAAFVVHLRQL